ncbi:MAG: T9SS type A sorting domain-containing protein [Bacteroidota bacterium]
MKLSFTHVILLLFVLALRPPQTWAQCTPRYYQELDQNQVNATLSNGGDHFWDFVGNPRYEVPKGSGKNSVFVNSLWIGGLDQSTNLHVAANTYRQIGSDFFTGPYRSSGNYTCDLGFTAGGNVFWRGLLTLASGKVAAFYSSGFTIYDPTTNVATDYVLPVIRNLYQALELPDGRVLLFGDDVYPVRTDAMLIDTSNFSVSLIGQLQHFHKWSSTTQLANGQIFISGLDGCEIFDPATSTSSPAAPMIQMRTRHTSVLLPNGKVLIAGGGSLLGGSGFIPTTEIYDPGSNTWTSGPFMTSARNSPESVRLPSGNILITGGSNTSGNFELYDPVANTITAVPGWPSVFNEHTALPLPTGEILITADNAFSTFNLRRLGRYDPVTQNITDVRLINIGSRAAYVNPNLALIEREPNRFAAFDLSNNQLVSQPWQKIWKVSRDQINQFIADQATNQVNFANYPDIQTWPANGDTALGEDFSLAPFVDVNQDGRYRPQQDGDYPCVEGDQALWWVYNDDGPHTETSGNAMGIQVEQMAYAYDCGSTPCTPDSFLDYATFHHLEITNKSTNAYEDCYVGVFLDVDLGNFFDDFIGSDSALNLGFVYNGDSVDEGSVGYGPAPPALGTVFLENDQIDGASNFMYLANDFSVTGNPTQPVHYYNYLRSVWTDGTPLVNDGDDGYGMGTPTNYIFSGDGGFCGGSPTGWSEVNSPSSSPFDRRYLQSYGPFDLGPGEKIKLDYAIIWTRGTSNLNSVCKLKQAAAVIDSFWSAQPASCFDFVLDRPETPDLSVEVSLYPNPNAGQFALELAKAPMQDLNLQVLDISGRIVHTETLAAQQSRHTVSTHGLSDGVYLVRITGEQIAVTRKMVVRH